MIDPMSWSFTAGVIMGSACGSLLSIAVYGPAYYRSARKNWESVFLHWTKASIRCIETLQALNESDPQTCKKLLDRYEAEDREVEN